MPVSKCDPSRATDKYEAFLPDGTPHPYLFRSNQEANDFLDGLPKNDTQEVSPEPESGNESAEGRLEGIQDA